MSYTSAGFLQWTFTTTSADSLTATGDAGETFKPGMPVEIVQVGFVVSTTVAADTTAPVVKFDKRPTIGSDTSRGDGDVGSVTIPDTTAAGNMIFDDVDPVSIDPGEEVVPQVTTAAADSGTAAGAGYPVLIYRRRYEDHTNITSMTQSA